MVFEPKIKENPKKVSSEVWNFFVQSDWTIDHFMTRLGIMICQFYRSNVDVGINGKIFPTILHHVD